MSTVFSKYAEIIPDFSVFQNLLRRPIPTHLRINTLKTDPGVTVHWMRSRGIGLRKKVGPWNTFYEAENVDKPGNLLAYFLGHIHPQAFTSCLASVVLAPSKGARVLDLCAAPGGKTSHMAQLMENSGLIVANELYAGRQVPLGHTLARLGVLNTVVTGYQAQQFPLRQRFDFVLADVPCSAEGTFRHQGDRAPRAERQPGRRLPELQKQIVARGFDLMSENGVMLYTTCTYNPEENEAVVDSLLRNKEAVVHPISLDLDHDPGISEWKGHRYDRQLQRAVRLYPHRTDSVGFFMAKIGRRGS